MTVCTSCGEDFIPEEGICEACAGFDDDDIVWKFIGGRSQAVNCLHAALFEASIFKDEACKEIAAKMFDSINATKCEKSDLTRTSESQQSRVLQLREIDYDFRVRR